VLSSSKHPAEAMAFARFLKTPGAQAILKRSGLEPVK
jgi:ABC-type molybdate transport system substrate-binding protein